MHISCSRGPQLEFVSEPHIYPSHAWLIGWTFTKLFNSLMRLYSVPSYSHSQMFYIIRFYIVQVCIVFSWLYFHTCVGNGFSSTCSRGKRSSSCKCFWIDISRECDPRPVCNTITRHPSHPLPQFQLSRHGTRVYTTNLAISFTYSDTYRQDNRCEC